ncbi:TetR/AcrR family transcriptional regulator [Rhodococcus daqingensis]|uniref:TetR/AcrR family transcriptional regulator n=1 Tax=Rhodococcus daqingensis TaxID=2479363 RepID=A0ABW2RZR4_9NOCA
MTDRRSRLLDATCRVIARDGIRGLRIENVAAEADASTALIYYHFGDRSGLLTQAMEHVNTRAETYADATEGTAGRERLVAQLLGEFHDDDSVRENSAVWGEVRAAAVFDGGLRPVLTGATERWVADLTALIEDGQRDGSIAASVDPRAIAFRMSALVEGLSNRWLAHLVTTDQARGHIIAALDSEFAAGAAAPALSD